MNSGTCTVNGTIIGHIRIAFVTRVPKINYKSIFFQNRLK